MERHCLECNAPLTGRSDKKFCDDLCRTAYHNRQNKEDTDFIRNVQSILRKNRKILAGLNRDGDKVMQKQVLIAQGFNFDFHTNSFQTPEGKTCFYCFDYGYSDENDGQVEILKRVVEEWGDDER